MKISNLRQVYPPMISGVSILLKRLANGMSTCGHTVIVMVHIAGRVQEQRIQAEAKYVTLSFEQSTISHTDQAWIANGDNKQRAQAMLAVTTLGGALTLLESVRQNIFN